MGQELADNKLQLAVFHGFEFAWEQNKHPDLKPLVIVVKGQNTKLMAQVIVAKDSQYQKLDDLKGQPVAIPKGTPEHARLFLARRTRNIGHRQEKFFSQMTESAESAWGWTKKRRKRSCSTSSNLQWRMASRFWWS